MSKPASLNRSDLARALLSRLLILGCLILLIGSLFPFYTKSLVYGVFLFLVNTLVFTLYAFRFSGSRSSLLMLQSFGRGIFIKLTFFALTLIVLFRLDASAREYEQSAVIFCAYFFMQACQIFWSIRLTKKL